MASNSVPKNRAKSAAASYVDEDRDLRDVLVLSAINSAILLIENDSQPGHACDVLRLARDTLQASWPHTAKKFTAIAEVAHA